MSRPNIGRLAEDFVEDLASKAFSPDFVFRSPRRNNGKEVTDVLVLFDDIALVIEAKAQAPDVSGHGYDSRSSMDWAKKHLEKAGRQISGAVRAIRTGHVKFVENRRQGRVPFESSHFPFIYGVILIDHKSDPYDVLTLIPRLADVQVPLHVLSFFDYMNLAKVLNTPNDLINYFDARSEILIPSFRPMVHEENKIFGQYLARLEEIMMIRSRMHEKPVTEEDVKTYADGLRKIIDGSYPNYRCGMIIDHIIDRLHDLDPEIALLASPSIAGTNPDKGPYARVATEIAKIPRTRRIEYGQRYLNAAKKAAETKATSWVRAYSKTRDTCMLFVSCPYSREGRRKRIEELQTLTALAKSYHMVSKAIGIATEPAGQMGSSYDVVLIERPALFDERGHELGRQLFESAADT